MTQVSSLKHLTHRNSAWIELSDLIFTWYEEQQESRCSVKGYQLPVRAIDLVQDYCLMASDLCTFYSIPV